MTQEHNGDDVRGLVLALRDALDGCDPSRVVAIINEHVSAFDGSGLAAPPLIINALQHERLNRDLSRHAVALLLGVREATLSSWERGHSSPSLTSERKIRGLLDKWATKDEGR